MRSILCLLLVGACGTAAPTTPDAAPSAAAPDVEGHAADAHAATSQPSAPPTVTPPQGGHHKLEGDALMTALGDDAPIELAHPAFEGPLGDQAKVTIYIPKTDLKAQLKIAKDGEVLSTTELQQWPLWEVNAVMFKNVDDDPQLELIVISQYMTGIGPQGAQPFYANAVFKLQGGEITRLEKVEDRIGSAPTGEAVSKLLSSR